MMAVETKAVILWHIMSFSFIGLLYISWVAEICKDKKKRRKKVNNCTKHMFL